MVIAGGAPPSAEAFPPGDTSLQTADEKPQALRSGAVINRPKLSRRWQLRDAPHHLASLCIHAHSPDKQSRKMMGPWRRLATRSDQKPTHLTVERQSRGFHLACTQRSHVLWRQ